MDFDNDDEFLQFFASTYPQLVLFIYDMSILFVYI